MKHFNQLVYFIMCVFIFSSCRTFKTVAPPENYETPVIQTKSSTISLPVELDIKDLENRVNKELKGTIYEDNSFENNDGDNLKVKAIKKDNFNISLTGNELTFRIPLRLEIQVKKIIVFPAVTAELAIKFKTVFTLNKDWTLNTRTVTAGYEWLSTPVITVAGYDVSIRYLADIILTAGRDKICKEIDKAVKSNINLKEYVNEAWETLQKPIKISDDYNVWLKITPSDIMATQFTGVKNKVKVGIGIKSVNEVFMGSEPRKDEVKKLPDLTLVSKVDPKFSLNLNADIAITKINELAEKELIGQVFTEGKKHVQIKSIKFYGSNGFFVVEVGLIGSLKGKVFLKGTPDYNPADSSIFIRDVDFDINTKNALLKSASWLAHGKLIKMIQPSLKYSIASQIQDIKKQIHDNLKENRSVKGLLIRGDVNNIAIDKIYTTAQSIKVNVLFEGVMQVVVESLSELY